MSASTHYDPHVGWYEDFRPAMPADELAALECTLGRGNGRCLDIGCGTGVVLPALRSLGWTPVGVDASVGMLARAEERGEEVHRATAEALPFDDASFDGAVSIWTHTDVDDFPGLLREAARVLRPGAPFAYLGAHPCFVGPHSRFIGAVGVPELHPGYLRTGRYTDGPGVGPDGLRAKVGGAHLPLGAFLRAFLDAGFRIELFEELAVAPERAYPYVVAVGCRR